MRRISVTAIAACIWGWATAASAAPSLRIDNAAARVTVIPEARSDITVSIVKRNARLPLKMTRTGDAVRIDGDLLLRLHGCHSFFGKPGALVWGIGSVGYDDLPQVVIRAPMNAKVEASGAVFGSIGRTASLDLDSSGCGGWSVADVSGPLRARVAGSGALRAGGAASADIRLAGSGDVSLRQVERGLTTVTSGSGDTTVGQVIGPLQVRLAGSGDLRVRGGRVTDMNVSVAGSGDVSFGGVAETLVAKVAGSGDVTVGKVTGAISKHVAGSGDVRIGARGI
jgi:Putative auto-transporter adhesin, head GIN domain